jgi:hypothetical protein|tara:strand:- start:3905 stop:4081 length:177 start_codon:yes stop_codon:yes gene_type:complete
MSLAITDIMKATKCTESQAVLIETYLDDNWLIDWSRDSYRKINKAAREAVIALELNVL